MSKLLQIIFTVMPNRNRWNRILYSELSFCSFHISWSHLKFLGELMNVFPEVKFSIHLYLFTLCGEGAVSFFLKKIFYCVSDWSFCKIQPIQMTGSCSNSESPWKCLNAYSPHLRLLHYRLMTNGFCRGPLESTCCIVLTYMTFKDI